MAPHIGSAGGRKSTSGHTLYALGYLEPEHELIQALGISRETCEHFGAGYATRGAMKGRLVVPLHRADGAFVT